MCIIVQAAAPHRSPVSVNVPHQPSTADPAGAPLAQPTQRAASAQPVPACQAAGLEAVSTGPPQGVAVGAAVSQLLRAMGRDHVSKDRIDAADRKYAVESALMRDELAEIVPRHVTGQASLISVTCLRSVDLVGQEEGGQSSSSSSDEESEVEEGDVATADEETGGRHEVAGDGEDAASEDEEETGGRGEDVVSEVEGDDEETESEATEDEEDANRPPSRPPGLPLLLPAVPSRMSDDTRDNARNLKAMTTAMAIVMLCVKLPDAIHDALWDRITNRMLPIDIGRFLHGPYARLCDSYAAFDVPGMEEIVMALIHTQV